MATAFPQQPPVQPLPLTGRLRKCLKLGVCRAGEYDGLPYEFLQLSSRRCRFMRQCLDACIEGLLLGVQRPADCVRRGDEARRCGTRCWRPGRGLRVNARARRARRSAAGDCHCNERQEEGGAPAHGPDTIC